MKHVDLVLIYFLMLKLLAVRSAMFVLVKVSQFSDVGSWFGKAMLIGLPISLVPSAVETRLFRRK